MKSDATTCESHDILSSRWRVFELYWLPAIAIVAVGPLAISSGWRAVVWTIALATMGMACIVNALRCGRVHCWLTGPFFLLMALAALLYGLGILHLGGNGWSLLGLIALVGTIALSYLPEMFLGKYDRAARLMAVVAESFLRGLTVTRARTSFPPRSRTSKTLSGKWTDQGCGITLDAPSFFPSRDDFYCCCAKTVWG